MWALRQLEIRLLQCALCFYLSVQIGDAAQQQRDVSTKNTAPGCFHNNTMFADTSIIPSTEPCLLCKCSNKNLICVRRVCKDQPYPPPRSCILVHKKSVCCPYLSCSKYHINFYKNSERNRYNQLQVNHEKVLEKNSRTDDSEEETNGGCIESGSLYASGSAMVKSSSSLCSYCYCINGQQKCIKPKCVLSNTKCKPIFMDASCCPVKYDCSSNSTELSHHDGSLVNHRYSNEKRKNRSNGCFESGRYYQEGEKLPSDKNRPCEMCYCIKGFRKCVMKKCAPLIKGCIPRIPKEGNCCPTSYDCSRSLKVVTRQVRQKNDEDEPEEENDSIDFFSLLFGSDEPTDEVNTDESVKVVEVTTLQPFKVLQSTEKSFFDLIRAGLEAIDDNADTIGSQINVIATTLKDNETSEQATTIDTNNKRLETTTEKFVETTQHRKTLVTKSSYKPTVTTSTTIKFPEEVLTSSLESTTVSSTKLDTTVKMLSTTPNVVSMVKITAQPDIAVKLKVSSTTTLPPISVKTKSTTTLVRKTEKTTQVQTTPKVLMSTTTFKKEESQTTSPKVLVKTTRIPPTKRTTFKPTTSTTQSHQKHEILFSDIVLPDKKIIETDDNEAETLPNIKIIPFVAHDAIDTEKFEPYLKPYDQPYDNLEKDYFANDKEKPFRYNNKFIHHSYDDSADYAAYANPHERIDNGPYYFESNDNQFDAFSPPSEQDFLGGFSPKESIYDEVSTIASELPLKRNEFHQKPLDAPTIHEHKSNVTLSEKTLTSPINQTTEYDDASQHNVIPDFKKISSNFTSYIDELLHENVLDVKTTVKVSSTTSAPPTSTSKPIKSIINDDDFIIKHLKAPTATAVKKTSQGVTEIFSKPTSPTMNGLLKLAGCNIYGQMYEVGKVIDELSNACLECKCLPDIGVGCTPKC